MQETLNSGPIASVIVPTHNSEKYLTECLDSVLAQTLEDLELIVVDDCSTDNTVSMLEERAQADGRMRIIKLETNEGPGIARNRGIDEAKGTYLYFLDSDDFCDSRLLEKAVARLEATKGDVCAFRFSCLNMAIDENVLAWWYLPPESQFEDLKTWRDYPDTFFNVFQNLAWNKVFRRSFIEDYNIRFQDIHLTEDLMFTAIALVRASGIAALGDSLVTHREATGTNTMSNKDVHPFDFITAFYAFKDYLENEGLMDGLRHAYLNWTVDGCFYNLSTISTYEAYCAVFDRLAQGAASDLGLFECNRAGIADERYELLLSALEQNDAQSFLFRMFHSCNNELNTRNFELAATREYHRETFAELDAARKKLGATLSELDALRIEHDRKMHSAEQRVGQAVCKFPRFVQRKFFRK